MLIPYRGDWSGDGKSGGYVGNDNYANLDDGSGDFAFFTIPAITLM
jgi:hypothetical protein